MAENKNIEVGGRLHSIATGNVLAGANEIFDDSKNKKQSVINAETDAALEDRYTKGQTYNKSELNNMITTPNQEYNTYTATSQDTDVSDILPSEGSADTVYRVGNWDGSQFDETVYSEYAWNGSQYIHLSTKTKIGEVFDISAYHATGGTLAIYDNLTAALDSENGGGVPSSLRKGGMSVKFVQSSDNKYVQYFLPKDEWSASEDDWEKTNLEKEVDYVGKKVKNVTYIREATPDGSRIKFYTDSDVYIGHLDNDGFHVNQLFLQSSEEGESENVYAMIMGIINGYLKNVEYQPTTEPHGSIDFFTDEDGYIGHIDDNGFHAKDFIVQSSKNGNGFSLNSLTSVDIILPDDIYVLSDRTSQLFYSGIIKAVDYQKYDLEVTCSVGVSYKRYYQIPSSTAGTYSLQIKVKGNNGEVYADKTCTLHVISPSAPSASKNVLVIGASNIEPGDMPAELWRMLNDDGGTPAGLNYGNVNFVGSHRGTVTSIDYPDVFMEAHGGWSWNTYMSGSVTAIRMQVSTSQGLFQRGDLFTLLNSQGSSYITYQVQEINLTDGVGNIRLVNYNGGSITTLPTSQTGILYKTLSGGGWDTSVSISFSSWVTESFAPFISNGVFTFLPYAQEFCDSQIDILVCNLGINQIISPYTSVDTVIQNAKTFIDKFHSEFPSSKVVLDLAFLMSQNYPYNDIYGMSCKFQEYNKRLIALSEDDDYSDFVSISPVNAFFDLEYMYPQGEKDVNTRSTTKELVGTNQLHPTGNGRKQISDAVLPILFLNF